MQEIDDRIAKEKLEEMEEEEIIRKEAEEKQKKEEEELKKWEKYITLEDEGNAIDDELDNENLL